MAVVNAVFCMTSSLLLLVEDVRRDHMEEAYFRVGLMNVSFCFLYSAWS